MYRWLLGICATALTACAPHTSMEIVDLDVDFDSTASKYIHMCSGMDNLDRDATVYMMAYANCLGRVRGIADSHQLTVAMNPTRIKPMWCIDQGYTDQQVLEVVLDNVKLQPDLLNAASSLGNLNAAVAIAVASLTQAFPCVK